MIQQRTEASVCEASPVFSICYPAIKKRRYAGDIVGIWLHVFLHVEKNERTEFFPLVSSGGVAADSCELCIGMNLLAFVVFRSCQLEKSLVVSG
jgi:hypothetical protein